MLMMNNDKKYRYINLCRVSQKCLLTYKKKYKSICPYTKWHRISCVYHNYLSTINKYYRMKRVTRSIFKFHMYLTLNPSFTIIRDRKETIK